MAITTKQQGDAVTLAVPEHFHVGAGVRVEPKLLTNGIFYEFVRDDDVLDAGSQILQDLLVEGIPREQMVSEYNRRKREVNATILALSRKAREQ